MFSEFNSLNHVTVRIYSTVRAQVTLIDEIWSQWKVHGDSLMEDLPLNSEDPLSLPSIQNRLPLQVPPFQVLFYQGSSHVSCSNLLVIYFSIISYFEQTMYMKLVFPHISHRFLLVLSINSISYLQWHSSVSALCSYLEQKVARGSRPGFHGAAPLQRSYLLKKDVLM